MLRCAELWLPGQPISLFCSCHPAHFSPFQPLRSDLSPIWVPLHVAECGLGEKGEIYAMRFLLCAKGLESSLSQTQAPHLSLSSPPLSLPTVLQASFCWVGDFWLPFPVFPLPYTYTQHNFCLSSPCLCSRASRSPEGTGWGPLSTSGES